VAPCVGPATVPSPLYKGKRGCKQRLRPGGSGGSEEERRRRLRHADESFVSDPQKRQRTAGGVEEAGSQAQGTQRRVSPPPPPPSGPPPPQPPPPSVQLPPPPPGVISPRGTSSSSSNNNNSSSSNRSGRPSSRVAGKSRAPSKCGPFLHESNYHVDRSSPIVCSPGIPRPPLLSPHLLRQTLGPPMGLALSSRNLLGAMPAVRLQPLPSEREIGSNLFP
jgi:hypothetical protein